MKELPGLFGRTNKGKIFRYANVENEVYKLILVLTPYGYAWKKYWLSKDENIELSGEEIIDVIKIGDFVNAHVIRRISIDPFNGKKILSTNESEESGGFGDRALIQFHNEDIKSVVTIEQFASIIYKEEKGIWKN